MRNAKSQTNEQITYTNLYFSNSAEQTQVILKNILYVDSEKIPNITTEKIENTLSQLENRRPLGKGGIAIKMIKMEAQL